MRGIHRATDPPSFTANSCNLFEDLVADGRVEIWLRCLQPAQYFGAAQPDLYLRARDASFAWNFAKGYFGIWLQMVLLIGFGVTFSTFLSGPGSAQNCRKSCWPQTTTALPQPQKSWASLLL